MNPYIDNIGDRYTETLSEVEAFRNLPAEERPTYEGVPNDRGEANSNSFNSSVLFFGLDLTLEQIRTVANFPGLDTGENILFNLKTGKILSL